MEAIMRERNSNSRIAFQATAEGGDRFAFEFLSRSAPPCKHWGNLPSVIEHFLVVGIAPPLLPAAAQQSRRGYES
jgi:hypothetical protein